MANSTSVLIRSALPATVAVSVVVGDPPFITTPIRVNTVPPAAVAGVGSVPVPVVGAGETVAPVGVNGPSPTVPTPTVATGSKVLAVVVAGVATIPLPTLTAAATGTLRQNTAEAMSSGSTLAAGQTGGGDPFDQITGTITYDSAQKMHQSQSFRVTAAAGVQIMAMYLNANDNQAAVRCYFRLVSLPSIACDLVTIRNSSAVAAKLQLSGSNKIAATDSTGVGNTFATALTAGVWYRLELQCIVGTTTSNGTVSAAYYLGDSTTPQDTAYSSGATKNTGTTNITNARYGKITTATATLDAYFDDLAFNAGSAAPIGIWTAPTSTLAPQMVFGSASVPTPTITATGGKPTRTNTGPTAGTTYSTVSGAVSVNTAGTSYSKVNFTGIVTVNVANVTFTDCLFTGGGAAAAATGVVNCLNANVVNCNFVRCAVIPASPNYWLTGIIGHDYTADSCYIRHTVDGFGFYNTHSTGPVNVTIKNSLVELLAFYSPSPTNTDNKTHNDCIQGQGGQNVTITNNTLLNFLSMNDDPFGYVGDAETPYNAGSNNNVYYGTNQGNAAIQISGPISVGGTPAEFGSLTIDGNYPDGGATTFNFGFDPPGATNIGSVTNNQFGHNQRQFPGGNGKPADPVTSYDTTYTIGFGSTSTTGETIHMTPVTGNIYEDDLVAVTVRGTH